MGTPLFWIVFNVFVLAAIFVDLRLLHRNPHKVSLREAGFWTGVWIALAVLFGLGVTHYYGQQRGLEFFTGYIIEQALSVDNLFLFLVIFRAFAVDDRVQHRLLEWGIVGALVMRGMMIVAGAQLIEHFSWVLYLLGGFLVYAGIRMFFKQEDMHPEKSRIARFAQRHLRVAPEFHGESF